MAIVQTPLITIKKTIEDFMKSEQENADGMICSWYIQYTTKDGLKILEEYWNYDVFIGAFQMLAVAFGDHFVQNYKVHTSAGHYDGENNFISTLAEYEVRAKRFK